MTITSELTVVDTVAMQMIESLRQLCDAASSDIRGHVPELGHVDPAAPAAVRRGLERSYGELCSLLRSGYPVAATPPVGALEMAIALRESGLGWSAAESVVCMSIRLFHRVAAALGGSPGLRARDEGDLDALLAEYWVQYAAVLADGYEGVRVHEPEPLRLGEPLPDPPGAPRTEAYLAERAIDSGLTARVRAHSEAIIDSFCNALEAAAEDSRVAAKLAGAGTSVAIVLADDEDVCATLLLDREPIEIARGISSAAEATIWITEADLQRLGREEFHLAMAMARGRVRWAGPVRKFLRVAPVIVNILATTPQAGGNG